MSEAIPIYEWRMAPAHLRTVRQLAAQGLRKNGQDIAGRLPLHGKFVYLYDVNLAAPKRPATAANLAALAKATRERQLRAAERRGIARAEFEQATEPQSVATEPESPWDRPYTPPEMSGTPAVRTEPLNAFAAATLAEQESGWER